MQSRVSKVSRPLFLEANRKIINFFTARLVDSSDASYSVSVWRENIREQKYEEKFFDVKNLVQPEAFKNNGTYELGKKSFLTYEPFSKLSESTSIHDPEFGYILLQGLYRVKFIPCSSNNISSSSNSLLIDENRVCDESNVVASETIRVEETSPRVLSDKWCISSESGQHEVDDDKPSLETVRKQM